VKLDQQEYVKIKSRTPNFVLSGLVFLNVLLGLLFFLFPKDGINIIEDFNLKFYNYAIFSDTTIIEEQVDLAKVLENVNIEIEEQPSNDSTGLIADKTTEEHNWKLDHDDATLQSSFDPNPRSFQIPESNPEVFRNLKEVLSQSSTRLIRFLHYGDSQLEGDRITDYFRQKLQEKFGGGGTGMLLPKEPTAGARRTAYISHSSNIVKKAIYLKKGKPLEGRFGLGASAFEFQGNFSKFLNKEINNIYDEDSVEIQEVKWNFSGENSGSTYFKVKMGKNAFPKAHNYQRFSLFYYSNEPFKVKLQYGDTSFSDIVDPDVSSFIKSWDIPIVDEIEISFTQGAPNLILGVSLDSKVGVTVDNFAMRGSSAIGFTKINNNFFGKLLSQAGVKLIVLQYGINVVPNVVSDYSYYKRMLSKELAAIRAANPDIAVLVIGPSDMSRKTQNGFASYPNIPKIRDAMKGAAFDNGCAFWDLYEAMGGYNSMQSWVAEGLAQKDYTHFSHKGARYIGEMFYKALMETLYRQDMANNNQ